MHLLVLLCFTLGEPSCADITSPVASSVTATWRALDHPWFLPVWFEVVITSGNQTKSINTTENKINISSIQHMTAYAISVTPCNTVGCREGCPPYEVNITTPPVNATAPPTKGILAFNASIYIAPSRAHSCIHYSLRMVMYISVKSIEKSSDGYVRDIMTLILFWLAIKTIGHYTTHETCNYCILLYTMPFQYHLA